MAAVAQASPLQIQYQGLRADQLLDVSYLDSKGAKKIKTPKGMNRYGSGPSRITKFGSNGIVSNNAANYGAAVQALGLGTAASAQAEWNGLKSSFDAQFQASKDASKARRAQAAKDRRAGAAGKRVQYAQMATPARQTALAALSPRSQKLYTPSARQIGAAKGAQTRMNTIMPNGLSEAQNAAIKASATKRATLINGVPETQYAAQEAVATKAAEGLIYNSPARSPSGRILSPRSASGLSQM